MGAIFCFSGKVYADRMRKPIHSTGGSIMAQKRNTQTPQMVFTGNRIRELRKERKESQTTLAQAIGASVGIISMWERADRLPSKENLEKLAQHFLVSVDSLQSAPTAPTRPTDPQAPTEATDAPAEPPGTVPVELGAALMERVQAAATAQGIQAADWITQTIARPLELFEIQQRHSTQNSDFETYTVEEVAALLDVTDRTVKVLIHDGQLNARKIGRRWRVTPENLKAYINGVISKA